MRVGMAGSYSCDVAKWTTSPRLQRWSLLLWALLFLLIQLLAVIVSWTDGRRLMAILPGILGIFATILLVRTIRDIKRQRRSP